MKNQLAQLVEKIHAKPAWLRYRILSFALGSTVKFVGTAGVKCIHLSQNKSIFKLENKKKVRNHIGTVHATATALVAETATGMLLGMNIPDNKIPVLKSMHIDYVKRSTGAITARAEISPEQVQELHALDKGSTFIKCYVSDDENIAPVECQFEWAWVPKKP